MHNTPALSVIGSLTVLVAPGEPGSVPATLPYTGPISRASNRVRLPFDGAGFGCADEV